MLAQACTRTPLAKRETVRSLIGYQQTVSGTGKTSWTTEKKIRQMLDAIQAKCLFLLLTLEGKRGLCLQNDHSSVTNEKAIKSCAVVFHPFSQWSQIGP